MKKMNGVGESPSDRAADAPELENDLVDHICRLYRLWLKMEANSNENADPEWRDNITDAQTSVMGMMESLQARTFEAVLFKLLIWNRETMGAQIESAGRADRLAHSAVRDLAALCGLTELFEKPPESVAGKEGRRFSGSRQAPSKN
ncbi:MAG: hypothetical protein KDA46_07320 [Parvularculaceae bacterium]|nr:hypothetical protein [Parvularculaceae bacterium]